MSDIPPHRITRTHLLKNFGRAENAKPPALSLAVLKAHLVRQSYKKQKVAPKPLKRIAANKALVSSTIPSAALPVALTVVAPMSVEIAPNEPALIEIDMSATSPAISALIERNLDSSTSSALPHEAPSPTYEISPAMQPSESLPTSSTDPVSAHDSDTLGVRVISRLMLVNALSAHSVESLARIRVHAPRPFGAMQVVHIFTPNLRFFIRVRSRTCRVEQCQLKARPINFHTCCNPSRACL